MQVICEKVSVKESWKDIMTMDGLQGVDINKSVAMSYQISNSVDQYFYNISMKICESSQVCLC